MVQGDFAEELVVEAPGLSAEELVEGRLDVTPIKAKKISKKKKTKPLTKAAFRKEVRRLAKKQKAPRRVKLSRQVLKPQQVVLSKEQGLLRSMFGGGMAKPTLLDRPGQFFDGSNFPFARPQGSQTAAMFGGQGFGTRKFFLPNKSRRRPTI